LKDIAELERVQVLIPLHPNPKTKLIIQEKLIESDNVMLIEAVDHLTMIGLMQEAYLVITDSGGIQEETPYLGIPTIVTRETTERNESCLTNNSILTGANSYKIIQETKKLLQDTEYYSSRSKKTMPYGDGNASFKIWKFIKEKIL